MWTLYLIYGNVPKNVRKTETVKLQLNENKILQCTLPIWRIKINKRVFSIKQTRQSNKYALKKINRSFKNF